MKKEYMKPEVNEIAVEANQAIAACAVSDGGFMCSGSRVQGANGYPTAQAAWEQSSCVSGSNEPHGSTVDGGAHWTLDPVNYEVGGHKQHWIFPVSFVSGVHPVNDQPFSFWVHDVNRDGKLSGYEEISYGQNSSVPSDLFVPGSSIAGIFS